MKFDFFQRNRTRTLPEMVGALQERFKAEAVETEASNMADLLEKLRVQKERIIENSKRKYMLERELRKLDGKIRLAIQNRISVQDVIAQMKGLKPVTAVRSSVTLPKPTLYEKFITLLYDRPRYLATVLSRYRGAKVSSLVETIVFSLYGDEFDRETEYQLMTLFKITLSNELDASNQLGSFLRANTAVTQILTAYSKRASGKKALRQILQRPLSDLNTQGDSLDTIDLEVNPTKVHNSIFGTSNVTYEEASQNEQVQAIIKPRLEQLEQICESILEEVFTSIQVLPFGIRYVCRIIYDVAAARFPEAQDTELYSLCGGFVFLRFLNPAIVAPFENGVFDERPSKTMQRNLILIAKLLQNVSNDILYGDKEEYMTPLNDFIVRMRDRRMAYLHDLIQVELQQLEMPSVKLQHFIDIGSTSTQRTIYITINEALLLHTIVEEYKGVIMTDPSGDTLLKAILMSLDTPMNTVPTEKNMTIAIVVAKDLLIPEPEPERTIQEEAKYTFAAVIRVLPAVTTIASNKTELVEILRAGVQYFSEHEEFDLAKDTQRVISYLTSDEEKTSELSEELVTLLMKEAAEHDDYMARFYNEMELLEQTDVELMESLQEYEVQLNAYNQYLECIRAAAYQPRVVNAAKMASAAHVTVETVGPFKYSTRRLLKKGVVSHVDPDSPQHPARFAISSNAPGVFEIVAKQGKRKLFTLELDLDDLLMMQAHNHNTLKDDDMKVLGLKLHVNPLVTLINKKFILKRRRRWLRR
eukprot:GFYU01022846.1.p1 GENE.GFYU01022846.1~~GFYU01022846.1.p1  ORF type:complete len:756 (-),score=195.07 GFYU01022846.1:273-2540(-)